MQETWVRSLGLEDPLEEEMATHCSILARKIPWTEEPGRLQSMGLQGWIQLSTHTHTHFRPWWKCRSYPISENMCGCGMGSPVTDVGGFSDQSLILKELTVFSHEMYSKFLLNICNKGGLYLRGQLGTLELFCWTSSFWDSKGYFCSFWIEGLHEVWPSEVRWTWHCVEKPQRCCKHIANAASDPQMLGLRRRCLGRDWRKQRRIQLFTWPPPWLAWLVPWL